MTRESLRILLPAICVAACMALALPAAAQHPGTAARLDAQRDAMARLAALDGTWRGTATYHPGAGAPPMVSVHTERVGPFLDGTVKVIEGRSFRPDGRVAFNAFAIVSFDPDTGAYAFRSYAMGHANDFPFEATDDGFRWTTTSDRGTTVYTTTIKDGTWHEVGERHVPGQAPVRFIQLELQRLGDSDWPAAGAVGPADHADQADQAAVGS